MPSNTREPICRWVSCGIMDNSRSKVSGRQSERSRACFGGDAKVPSVFAKSGPCHRRAGLPGVQLLDVTGPVQVFASANDLIADAGGAPPYLLRLVTQGDQGVMSSAGVAL